MALRNWLPSDLETQPATWLDASDPDGVDAVSGKAAGLIDKSGNDNSALQATVGSRPAVLADAINGLTALDFDGVDDYLAMSTPIISLVHTVFVVAAPTAEAAIGALVGQYSAGTSGRHYMGTNQADTGLTSSGRFNVFNNTATSGNGSSGLLDDTAFVGGDAAIFSTINLNTGEGFRFIKDGTVVDTATVTVVQQTNTGIGAERAAGPSVLGTFDGLFGELVVVQAALSDSDRKKVEGYLAHKWGIAGSLPPGHDYKDSPPQIEAEEVPTLGTITGTVKIDGVAAQRQLIGISYAPQEFDGEDEPRRIVVGETTSAEDGTYTLETPGFIDEVIVLALDNYGEIWRPNRAYEVGDRIRPTRGNETGYGYDITIAGDSGSTEPEWWVPAGGSDTGSIGAATAQAKPLWWSVAHAPILPTPSEAPEVLWTPANTTTELWLDFSDRDNYTAVAEAYSLVNDKSGNDRDASQGTAANRPTRVTEGQNGLDFARFDGSNDILQLVAFAQASGQHLFIFADTTSLQSGYRASVDRSSGSASNLGALFGASPQNYKPCFYWNGNQRAVQTSAVQRKAGIRWHFTVGSPSMALTQVDADTAVSETFTAAALTNWATIGGPGALPAVDIYEVVMLPGTATTDDINRVWGYGMHKWGLDALLPSDFVYKDAPPIVE